MGGGSFTKLRHRGANITTDKAGRGGGLRVPGVEGVVVVVGGGLVGLVGLVGDV
jgi:hypothetical protein